MREKRCLRNDMTLKTGVWQTEDCQEKEGMLEMTIKFACPYWKQNREKWYRSCGGLTFGNTCLLR
jgi:hypothetical protein